MKEIKADACPEKPQCFGDYACGAEECEFCKFQEECMEESYPPGTFEEADA